MHSKETPIEYLSLKAASEACQYTQEYLSLRARQGKLKALKLGRNWVTTKAWLDEYIATAEDYKNGNGKPHKMVSPPENLPIEFSFQEVKELRRAQVSPFAALRFGVVTAALVLVITAGAAFGKDGWYQLGRELSGSFQDFAEGFDTAAQAATKDVARLVQDLGEGLDAGSVKQVRGLSQVANSFGNGFDTGASSAARTISKRAEYVPLGVLRFGEGFSYGVSSPASVGGLVKEYLEWLEQGIVSLPQNAPRDLLVWDARLREGIQRDLKGIARGYEGLNSVVEQGMTRDLSLAKDSLARLRQAGQGTGRMVQQGATYLVSGSKEVTQAVERGYNSLNKIAEDVVQGAWQGATQVVMEKAVRPIRNAISNGIKFVTTPWSSPEEPEGIAETEETAQPPKEPEQEPQEQGTIVVQGPPGPAGPRGPEGPRGLTGPQGSPGSSGIITSTEYISGPQQNTTVYYQGSNVFQGSGSFTSLGIGNDLSVGRTFSSGGSTVLGTTTNDLLNVNATTTFTAPITIEDQITITDTASFSNRLTISQADTGALVDIANTGTGLALSVTSGAVQFTEAGLALASKVADDILLRPMFDNRSLTGTRGQLATYTDATDSIPTFTLVQDSSNAAPGGRGYTVGTGTDTESLTYPTAGNIDADDGAISLWFSPSFNASAAGGNRYLFETVNHVRIYFDSAARTFVAAAHNGTDFTTASVSSAEQSFSSGNWLHIVLAFDNNGAVPLALYVNNARTTDSDTWTAQALPASMFIGSDSSTLNHANGTIADFTIFNRVLTQQEVQQIYYLKRPLQDYAHTTTPYDKVVTVAKYGGDYTAIQAALDALTGSATQPALVQVMPGVYTEAVTMEAYVDIVSTGGPEVTTIQQTTATVVTGASNSRLSGFTLNKTTDNANAIVAAAAVSPTLENLIITGGGIVSQVGISSTSGSPDIVETRIDNVNLAITTATGSPVIRQARIGLTTQPVTGVSHTGASGTTTLASSIVSATTDDVLVSGNGATLNSTFNWLRSATGNIETAAGATINSYKDTFSIAVNAGTFNQQDYVRNDALAALHVNQQGAGNIAQFQDGGTTIFQIADGGLTTLNLTDNTADILDIQQGTSNYFTISTSDATASLLLDLPVAGITSTTANLFVSNVAKTINLGTGTALDIINIGTGATGADVLNIGSANAGNITVGSNATIALGSALTDSVTIDSVLLSIDSTDTANISMSANNAAARTFTISAANAGAGAGNFTLNADDVFDLNASTVNIDGSVAVNLGTTADVPFDIDTSTLDIDSSGAITLDSTSTFSIDGVGASNVTATSGNLTLSTVTTGNIVLTSAGTIEVTGNVNITGNLSVSGITASSGDVDLGDTVADTVTLVGRVDSAIIPSASSTFDLGTASLRWREGFFDTITASNLSGTVVTGATSAATWTINSDNATANAEISSIAFETGTNPFNAVVQWNALGDAGRFAGYDNNLVSNYPISIISEVSGINQSFTGGSLFNYGQAAAHAITQTAAFVGLDVDFSSNITVPNSAAGNQTGVLATLKDGGASATSVGLQTAGTLDIGLDVGGTIGTADIRLSNGATVVNASTGLVTFDATGASAGFTFSDSIAPANNVPYQVIDTGGTRRTIMGIDAADQGFLRAPNANGLQILASGGGLLFMLTDGGNFGMGTSSFGTNAASVLAFANGTAPTTSPGDTVQLWAADFAAGDSRLYLRTESQTGNTFFGNNAIGTTAGALQFNAATQTTVDTAQTVASGASATLDAFQVEGDTVTISGITNITTATGFNLVNVARPTYSNASIALTNAATFYIANSPLAAGGMTISNAYSLWVDAGTSRFDGHLIFGDDNQYDIGASGATRPRTAYIGTSVVVGSTTTITTNSVDASGALTLTTGAGTNLTFTPGTTGDLLFSTDADTVATFAGSAEGTANVTLTAGDLTLTDGDLTLSGGEIAATSDDATGTNFSFTTGALTTGTGVGIVLTANALTSGEGLSLAHTAGSATGSFSGNIVNITASRTNATAAQTLTDSGNLLDIQRTTITNNGTATTNVTGTLVAIADTSTQTLGTLTHTANVLSLTQNYASSSGAVLNIANSGTGADIAFNTSPTITIGNTGTLTVTDGTNILFSIADDTAEGDVTVTGDLAVNGATAADITSSTTTANVFNATVTTLNIGGAATTMAIGAAASATTWTGQSISFTGANSTSNTTLTVTNSTNSGVSHSIVDVAVGGTTSTGDPQVRWTIPNGGTSWYAGVDNSVNDSFFLGTGTAVGSGTPSIQMDPRTAAQAAPRAVTFTAQNLSLASAATDNVAAFGFAGYSITTGGGATPVTGLQRTVDITGPTWNQVGVRAENLASLVVNIPPGAAAGSVTDGAAIHIPASSSGPDNRTGIRILGQTGTDGYGISIARAGTAALWLSTDSDTADEKSGIVFGASKNVNLYRGATNVLQTDDSFQAGGTTLTLTGANSTNNSALLVQNTTNTAVAAHAIIEAAVGGTTSTGDPQVRWTIPGGTSWYAGVDNNDANDRFFIGTGTTVGSSSLIRLNASTAAGPDVRTVGFEPVAHNVSSGGLGMGVYIAAQTFTFGGASTGHTRFFDVGALTLASSAGAITVDNASSILVAPPTATTNMTITTSAALYIPNANAPTGTLTNTYGLYVESMTRGTNDYGIYIAGADTYALWVDAGDVRFDANLIVGGNTSAIETLANAGFLVNGDDLFVAGTAGIEGNVYTDGSFIAGATTTYADGSITFSSTTPSIVIGNTGTLSITDGTNTLWSLADAGTTGTATLTGDLVITSSATTGNVLAATFNTLTSGRFISASNATSAVSGTIAYLDIATNQSDRVEQNVGGVFTDNTAEANSVGGTAFNLLNTGVQGANDGTYFMDAATFSALNFDVATAGVGATIAVEYCSANAVVTTACDTWTAVSGLSDGTSNYTADGRITFTDPAGSWIDSTETPGNQGKWLRIRSTTSPTTAPTANYATISIFSGNFLAARSAGAAELTIDYLGNIINTDDAYIGLGSAAGRIEFDDQATDEVNILNANVGIGTTGPTTRLQISVPSGTSVTKPEGIALLNTNNAIGQTMGIRFDAIVDNQTSAAITAIQVDDTTAGAVDLAFITRSSSGGGATAERMRLTSTGNLQFSQATTISTTTGDLTLNPFNSLVFNSADFSGAPQTTTGSILEVQNQTFTDSSTLASGTSAAHNFSSFAIPTLAATNLTVTTTASANVYIAGAPAAGTNMTITNPYALFVDAGTSRFDGNLDFQDGAVDLIARGSTAASFEITNASVSLYSIDTRSTTNAVNTHLFTPVAPTIASATGVTFSNVSMNSYTLTLTGTTTVNEITGATLYLGRPVITDTSAVTVTSASTLYVENAPIVGGSVSITNAYAINAGAGAVRADRFLTGTIATPVHDINSSSLVVFNEQGADIDFRVESDTNENAFMVDAGLFTGVGAVGIGNVASNNFAVRLDAPAFTAVASTDVYRFGVQSVAALTIPTGITTNVGTVNIDEPNITATGTVTNAFTLRVVAAPTEGTNNYALWVDEGESRFDRDSIGATATDGIRLHNSTDAAAGAQQYSPAIRWHGEGWKTNAIAASQNVDWRAYVVPVEGATIPNSYLYFDASANDAAFSNAVRFRSIDVTGTPRLEVTGTIGTSNANGPALLDEAASDTNPTLIPDKTVLNTGIGLAAGNLKIIVAGNRVIEVGSSSVNISNNNLVNTADVGIGTSIPTAGLDVDQELETVTAVTMRAIINNTNAITTNTGATAVYGLQIDEPNITVGTLTPTDSASLYITGAATEATNNYALWVDAGTSRFDGNTVIGPAAASPTLGRLNVLPVTAVSSPGASQRALNATFFDTAVDVTGQTGNTVSVWLDGSIFTATAPTVVSNAASVYIGKAPTTSDPDVTITNSYALWVDAGTARFDGTINLNNISSISAPDNDGAFFRIDGGSSKTVGTTSVGAFLTEIRGGAQSTLQATANSHVLGIFATTGNSRTTIDKQAFTGLEFGVARFQGTGFNVSGAGTIDNAATIIVKDAPTLGTNNYALFVDAGTSRFDGVLLGSDGTSAAPEYSFQNDTDIGMYRAGTNSVGLSATASTTFVMNPNVTTNPNFLFTSTTSSADVVRFTSTDGNNEIIRFRSARTDTGSHTVIFDSASTTAFTMTFNNASTLRGVTFLAGASQAALDASPTTVQPIIFDTGDLTINEAETSFLQYSFLKADVTSGSAVTITNAATVYIDNAPDDIGVGPATITNKYALWVDAGVSRFDGNVGIGALFATSGIVPDNALHVANGSAGTVAGAASYPLTIESDAGSEVGIHILAPDASNGGIRVGSPADNNRAKLLYMLSGSGTPDRWDFYIAGNTLRLSYGVAAFAFQEATTVSSTANVANALAFQNDRASNVASFRFLNDAAAGGTQINVERGLGGGSAQVILRLDAGASGDAVRVGSGTNHELRILGNNANRVIMSADGTSWAFQQATTITTTAGDLTLNPFNSLVLNAADFSGAPQATTGSILEVQNQTFTDSSTAASGTSAAHNFSSFAQPTLAATNLTVTTTNAATLYIANSPANGTNMTITNPYALFVDAGTTRLDGTLQLGLAGTVTGVMNFQGITSGVVTIQPAAAAGTWTLTLPTTAGAANQFLQTNGSGVTTWAAGGDATTTTYFSTAFEALERLTTSQGGGGSAPSIDSTGLRLNSQTSAGFSSSSFEPFSASSVGGDQNITNSKSQWSIWFQATATSNDPEVFVAIVGNPTVAVSATTGHTLTTAHIGFLYKIVGGAKNLYATQANGTTETRSAALTTIGADDIVDVLFIVNASSVDYYWRKNSGSWSSATNLATNKPSGNMYRTQQSISTVNIAETLTAHIGHYFYRL